MFKKVYIKFALEEFNPMFPQSVCILQNQCSVEQSRETNELV